MILKASPLPDFGVGGTSKAVAVDVLLFILNAQDPKQPRRPFGSTFATNIGIPGCNHKAVLSNIGSRASQCRIQCDPLPRKVVILIRLALEDFLQFSVHLFDIQKAVVQTGPVWVWNHNKCIVVIVVILVNAWDRRQTWNCDATTFTSRSLGTAANGTVRFELFDLPFELPDFPLPVELLAEFEAD